MTGIKKRKIFLLFLPIFLLCFCKCKPEFSINSDSEPFPIVYGLLNVSDEIHYVKIFKSFVVEGNAYDVVKDIDMYSYKDSIEVYLKEYDTKKNLLRKIPMKDTINAIEKDSGLFLYPTQILYFTRAVLDKKNLYEIEVFNPYTKNVAKVKAPIAIVGDVSILSPASKELPVREDRKINYEFYTAEHANRYQLMVKYYYTEDFFDGTSRQPEPVVWNLGYIVDDAAKGGAKKGLEISSGASFFQRIASCVLPDDKVKVRHTDSLVLEVYISGIDWGLYVRSNQPSSGINQDRLLYSNMIAYNTETGEEKYATGVFSAGGVTKKKYDNLALNGPRDSLFHGRFTGHLLFSDIY